MAFSLMFPASDLTWKSIDRSTLRSSAICCHVFTSQIQKDG
jgi:hypothetical protein